MEEIKVMVADESHIKYVGTILQTIADAAKVRGTGIAKRSPEYVATKMKEAKAVIAAKEMPEEVWHKYGMIALKENGTLSHIVEKPKTPDLSPSSLTSYGRYLLTPEVFEYLVPSNVGLDNELWTVDAITKLAEVGDVIVAKSKGRWMTTGDPKNYFLAHLEYVLQNTDYADEVRKFIAEN